ncbi:acyl-CoA N-acyltransferase [Geopyxis carbonaria]|nr:acyl-CoA N-acyltransferase [Geopyxis carbonaria]
MSASNKPATLPASGLTFHLRPATLSDAAQMAEIATRAYTTSEAADFFNPHRAAYPSDYHYSFLTRYRSRLVDPAAMTWVVHPAGAPGCVVAHGQFLRVTSNPESRPRRDTWRMWAVRGWYAFLAWGWAAVGWKNRTIDPVSMVEFIRVDGITQKTYWSRPEWQERWHALSIVVDPNWQKRGLGGMLVEWIVKRAGKDGVGIGLEASAEGEPLYRKTGFRMLGRFAMEKPVPGGIMGWRPEGMWKGVKFGGEEEEDEGKDEEGIEASEDSEDYK